MQRLILTAVALFVAGPAAGQAPIIADATPVSSADPADDADQQVRCRRLPVTGSLVRRIRVCKTVAEWRRLSDRANDTVRDQFEDGLICSGGPCRGIEPPPG